MMVVAQRDADPEGSKEKDVEVIKTEEVSLTFDPNNRKEPA